MPVPSDNPHGTDYRSEALLWAVSDQRGILKQLCAVTSSPHFSQAPTQFLISPHSCPSVMPLERVRRKANPSLSQSSVHN